MSVKAFLQRNKEPDAEEGGGGSDRDSADRGSATSSQQHPGQRVDFDLNAAEGGSQESKDKDEGAANKHAKMAAGILKKKASRPGKSGDTNPQKGRPSPQKRPEEPK